MLVVGRPAMTGSTAILDGCAMLRGVTSAGSAVVFLTIMKVEQRRDVSVQKPVHKLGGDLGKACAREWNDGGEVKCIITSFLHMQEEFHVPVMQCDTSHVTTSYCSPQFTTSYRPRATTTPKQKRISKLWVSKRVKQDPSQKQCKTSSTPKAPTHAMRLSHLNPAPASAVPAAKIRSSPEASSSTSWTTSPPSLNTTARPTTASAVASTSCHTLLA